jgi:tetratricopeptide (TPR) repeat protein
MVEAADIREKKQLGRNALFAGQVQGASGQRVIEGRIQAEEKRSEDDPAYWRERAQYYRGRKETAPEEDALKKGLSLTTPQVATERHVKGGTADWRRWMLLDYAAFMKRVGREAEAVELLRKEIEHAPADAESAVGAASMLGGELGKHVKADDALLWTWLERRVVWSHAEERVLRCLLEGANRNDVESCFARAETLADRKDPSRSHALGWIMNRMQHPKRSVTLLTYAFEKAPAKSDLRENAAFTLFESYLDLNDWRSAEALFPEARRRLTPSEMSDRYGRIAWAAARAGAKEDALRIWKDVINVNPSETGALGDLVKAGLKDELVEFYRDLQTKMPSSGVPARALKVLEK